MPLLMRPGNMTFLGMKVRNWLILVGLVLLGVAWVRQWPNWAILIIALLLIWLVLSFWLAGRSNYIRFVPNGDSMMAASDLNSLSPNEKVPAQATGSFSVSGYNNNVLFQPANYWQVPLGDHIVMVEQKPGKFLYQFFSADTLQSVAGGWLLYGAEPQEALAISFLSKWGPEYTKFQVYEDGEESPVPAKLTTIYLTFESESQRDRVWQTIVADARRART
ncbi:MAG: hypothetical protein R3C44_17020 [Chloroflexota bacterium]